MTIAAFQELVWDYYHSHGRHDLPWRTLDATGNVNPYHVVVSELMLQQTQVPRVIPKFICFTKQFPSFTALAAAPLGEVIAAWSGLGYNRRAKFLWQTAQAVSQEYGGQLPQTHTQLVSLPGIGANTAGAIMAYAFNQPVIFIETNIRSIFIYHFFTGQTPVHDRELLPLLEQALPASESRDWYWALMDYGTYLKQTVGNISRASAAYAKQSAFHGSRRKIRGQVLKALTLRPHSGAELAGYIADERLTGVLHDLIREGMIQQLGQQYQLAA